MLPLVIRSCFPISTISISFVGLLSRSIMFAASRAGLGSGVHRNGDVGLGKCRGIVGAITGHCYHPTSRLILPDQLGLLSGVASARKSSTPASAAIVAAVRRLSPVIMMVLIPIRRSWANRSLIPPFTMSFK